jgi:hypothetical protein
MDPGDQHAYGRMFRALEELEHTTRELVVLTERLVSTARSGLATGALAPEQGQGD